TAASSPKAPTPNCWPRAASTPSSRACSSSTRAPAPSPECRCPVEQTGRQASPVGGAVILEELTPDILAGLQPGDARVDHAGRGRYAVLARLQFLGAGAGAQP